MKKDGKAIMKIAFGPILEYVSKQYTSYREMVAEYVQNAIDAGSKHVRVEVNLKSRVITIQDDGHGISRDEFVSKVLGKIGLSGKRKVLDALGKFGLGLMSALGKCKRFSFISCARPHHDRYVMWTFESEEIVSQEDSWSPPEQDIPHYYHGKTAPEGRHAIPWRTQVKIEQFDREEFVRQFQPERFEMDIQDKYGRKLIEHSCTVHLRVIGRNGLVEDERDIVGVEFSGVPIDPVTFKDTSGGETTFRLYAPNRSSKRRLSVRVVSGDKRVTVGFKAFAKDLADEWLPAAIIDALSSPELEGEIHHNRLDGRSDRRGFEQNVALYGLYESLESWWEATGKELVASLRDNREGNKNQEIALRVSNLLKSILKDPTLGPLAEVVNQFKRGTIGPTHARMPGLKIVPGETQLRGLVATPPLKAPDSEGGGHGSGSRASDPPVKDLPGHSPFWAAGPTGRPRFQVRDHSLGLGYNIQAFPNSWLFELNTVDGILCINTRHEVWAACKNEPRAKEKLVIFISLQALSYHSIKPEARTQSLNDYLDMQSAAYVQSLMYRESSKVSATSAFTGKKKKQ